MAFGGAKPRWLCLVHGVLGRKCGSSDVAPFGDGVFHRWSRPRDTDIYVNLTPPTPRPGYIVVPVYTAQEPGRTTSAKARAPRRQGAR